MKQAAIRKFSNIRSPPLSAAEPGVAKKSVPGPASPMHLLSLMMFLMFRRPMSINAYTKAGIYLCAAAGGSLVFDFVRIPPTYFSNKYNMLNQFFVKWGWGWTFICLSAFNIFASFIYTGGNVRLMRAHALRIIVGTGCWYSITGLLNYIHDLTGNCLPISVLMPSGERPFRRALCHRLGGNWLGFDISGHCFLLVLCNLWILEELKCMHHWQRLADILKPYDQNQDPTNMPPIPARVTADEFKTMRSGFRRLTGSVRMLFSLTACFSMLWDFMFIITIVYYHTMPTKLLGTLLGVACWFIAYRVVFPCAKVGDWFGFAPGLPGDSPIEFVPRR